jgi:hypothetical protein
MFRPHQGVVDLDHDFDTVSSYLKKHGAIELETSRDIEFTAEATICRDGRPVIVFRQHGIEYGRAYECCWGHYYSCNRTRIGSYCKSLDQKISRSDLLTKQLVACLEERTVSRSASQDNCLGQLKKLQFLNSKLVRYLDFLRLPF